MKLKDSTQTKFKVGDWLFCEFKLQQVKEVRDGHVTSVTDGYFEHSSRSLDDRCFPLDIRIKLISDNFSGWRDRLHREGRSNLNYPDIINRMIGKWCELCAVKDDVEAVNRGIKDLDSWCQDILDRCKGLSRETIGGVRLFR